MEIIREPRSTLVVYGRILATKKPIFLPKKWAPDELSSALLSPLEAQLGRRLSVQSFQGVSF